MHGMELLSDLSHCTKFANSQKVLILFLFLKENILCGVAALLVSTTPYIFVEKSDNYFVDTCSYMEL